MLLIEVIARPRGLFVNGISVTGKEVAELQLMALDWRCQC